MQTHEHPDSGATITGIKLAAGAILTSTDHYASRTGAWEHCPNPGCEIEQDCMTIWVRPMTQLPAPALELLRRMHCCHLRLTKIGKNWHIVREAAEEEIARHNCQILLDAGLIALTQGDLYKVTPTGRQYVEATL